MKKSLLSIGSIVLAGALLASCAGVAVANKDDAKLAKTTAEKFNINQQDVVIIDSSIGVMGNEIDWIAKTPTGTYDCEATSFLTDVYCTKHGEVNTKSSNPLIDAYNAQNR